MNTHATQSLNRKPLRCLIGALLLGTVPAMADPMSASAADGWLGRLSNGVAGSDDWRFADLAAVPPEVLDQVVFCSDGPADLMDPLPCATGSLEIRNLTAVSDLYADDPRLTGIGQFTFSASFDVDLFFSGPAWGSWSLEVCGGEWRGTFYGVRRFIPGQPQLLAEVPGVWVSDLDLRGRGVGGCIDGHRLHGTEHVTTLTPLPLSYENLGLCGAGGEGCLPEGTLAGRIYRPWHLWENDVFE